VASGPLPRETLDRIMALDALAIRGNADRELLERGGRGLSDDWVASQLVPRHEEWLRSLPETIELEIEQIGTVLFCHGSPRSDEEMMLRTTPEERMLEFVDGVEADVVVCGHTHMQFDRKVGYRRVVNAGSVGLPYGAPGAHWLLLGPGLEHRQTDYDVDAAAERLLAGGWPQAPKLVEENVRRVPSEEEALSFFEPLAKEQGWF
jgi:diadenosine tetraphosphatase ApaH/serine/threonine PP2A family protein phosphatase